MCTPGKPSPSTKPSGDTAAPSPDPVALKQTPGRVTRRSSPQRLRGTPRVSTVPDAEADQDEEDKKMPATPARGSRAPPKGKAPAVEQTRNVTLVDTDDDADHDDIPVDSAKLSKKGNCAKPKIASKGSSDSTTCRVAKPGLKTAPGTNDASGTDDSSHSRSIHLHSILPVVSPKKRQSSPPTKRAKTAKRVQKKTVDPTNSKKTRNTPGKKEATQRKKASARDSPSTGGSDSKSAPVNTIVLHRGGSTGTRGQIFGQKMRPTGYPHLVNYIITRNRIIVFYFTKANAKESPYTGALQNALSSHARETLERLDINLVATLRRSEREDEPILHQIKKSSIEHKCYLKSVPKEKESDIAQFAKDLAQHVATVCEQYSMQDQWSSKFEVGEDLTPNKLRPVSAYVMNIYVAAILVDVYSTIRIADLLLNEPLMKSYFGRRNYEAGCEIMRRSVDVLDQNAADSDGSDSDEYASDYEQFFDRQRAARAAKENEDPDIAKLTDDGDVVASDNDGEMNNGDGGQPGAGD